MNIDERTKKKILNKQKTILFICTSKESDHNKWLLILTLTLSSFHFIEFLCKRGEDKTVFVNIGHNNCHLFKL
jgi:hypothetical protein